MYDIELLASILILLLNVRDLECSCKQNTCSSTAQLDPILNDAFLLEGYVAAHIRSPIKCHRLCLEHHQCVSYFHGEIDKKCRLHSVKFITQPWYFSSQQLHQAIGTRYYVLKEPSGKCPDEYIWDRQLNKCYSLPNVTLNFANSFLMCFNNGIQKLVVIDTPQFRENIETQATTRALANTELGYYVGATFNQDQEQFVWLDATPVLYDLWQPDYPKSRYYVILAGDTWFLQDTVDNGDTLASVICEVKLPPSLTTPPPLSTAQSTTPQPPT